MTPDFITSYYPDLADVPNEDITSARSRLETVLAEKYPSLDTRVNSVFGDLVLTPHAYMLAAFEIAMGRFMSDLDLQNVAEGVIYNCDFVQEYLENFAIIDPENLKASGVVRLTFCADQDYTLDRRTRYSFGSDSEFTLRLPYTGGMIIKSSSGTLGAGVNTRKLAQVEASKWAVDVGVEGTMGSLTSIPRGTEGTTDIAITDLESVVASVNFKSGIDNSSLAELAERTRKTFYAATLSTRSGARHYLDKEFPELINASPVITGDAELMRSVTSLIGVPDGRCDIMVKSDAFAQTDEQIITFQYDPSNDFYAALVDFINPPLEITGIYSISDLDTNLNSATYQAEIYSATTDFAKAPMATAAYSPYEQLIVYIMSPPSLTNNVVGGDQFHDFKITYRTDPIIPIVSDDVSAPNNKPIGVDILAKGYTIIKLDSLTITYIKKPGTKMALDTARTEIYNYFRNLGYDNTYTDAKVADAMFYAGASDVVSIVPSGSIRWSVADKFIKYDVGSIPASDYFYDSYATFQADGVTPPTQTISSSSDLIPSYTDPNIGNASTQTYVAAGKRNVAYLLDAADIAFVETLA